MTSNCIGSNVISEDGKYLGCSAVYGFAQELCCYLRRFSNGDYAQAHGNNHSITSSKLKLKMHRRGKSDGTGAVPTRRDDWLDDFAR